MRLLFASVFAAALLVPHGRASAQMTPAILSRAQWGADESLLVKKATPLSSSSSSSSQPAETGDNGGGQVSSRVAECNRMYELYPDEFKTSSKVTENAAGEKLLWPQQYSPSVRMLVVHHTALPVGTDARSGLERMRALYEYHAKGNGWGDVGYHFVVDETGAIYEGRAGGDSVVGGHAYCNNVGTVGVALMGNFESEQPTQTQIRSLQWLLRNLAQKYGINLNRDVVFHGKKMPPIVGHRDLLSTSCPGLHLAGVMEQIRAHVRAGAWEEPVTFPVFVEPPPGVEEGETAGVKTNRDGLATLSETIIEGRPGAEIVIPVFFRAERKNYAKNARVARVTPSAGMKVWQEREGEYVAARDLRVPVPLLKKGESVILRVKVRMPMARGSATLTIGSLRYNFVLEGRSVRGGSMINTSAFGRLPENRAPSSRAAPMSSAPPSSPSSSSSSSLQGDLIRILLSSAGETPKLTAGDQLVVNGRRHATANVSLTRNGTLCETDDRASAAVLRVSAEGPVTVNGDRKYWGTIECRVIDGKLVLINELPLETYMAGLAEEPDTEPFEKQKAFAIAARTYALHYLDPKNRKFPGMPYDGSDSPATFQAYGGYGFEERNSEWTRAVRMTEGQVLRYRGEVIKPPYFSQSDGRTLTPAEAGWKTFPFAEIFSSKPDPWCAGMERRGHGVGMSGCGAEAQANEGKTAEQILQYYYPGTTIGR